MYKKFFEEFYVSENDLKARILQTLVHLSEFDPQEFPAHAIHGLVPSEDASLFVESLKQRVPRALAPVAADLDSVPPYYALRSCAIVLSVRLEGQWIESLSTKFIFKTFSSLLLGARYMIAVELIQDVLGEELCHDPGAVSEDLFDPFGSEQDGHRLHCAFIAEEEISRVSDHPATKDTFWTIVAEFEESAERYVRSALPEVLIEGFTRVFLEATMTNSHVVDSVMRSAEPMLPSETKEIIGNIMKHGLQRTSARLGIKRGGPRARKDSSWTDAEKIALYRQVEDLPKINGFSLWEYAFTHLRENDFNYKYIDYLRTQTVFKNVPEKLFSEAVRVWKHQAERLDSRNQTFSEKPSAFALRHALILLEFPDRKISTLQKYRRQGETLFKSTN